MINKTILVGRLVKDAELRYTSTGVAVANFRMAVNRPFSNNNGEKEADYINCITWRKQAENLSQFTQKGDMIGIDGRIQTRSYDNNDKQRVFVTEVVADSVQFLQTKGNKNGQTQTQNSSAPQQSPPSQMEPMDDFGVDDLPF